MRLILFLSLLIPVSASAATATDTSDGFFVTGTNLGGRDAITNVGHADTCVLAIFSSCSVALGGRQPTNESWPADWPANSDGGIEAYQHGFFVRFYSTPSAGTLACVKATALACVGQ